MGRARAEHRLKIALVSEVIVMRRLVNLLCVGLAASLAGWAVPALAGANPVEITHGSGSTQDMYFSTTLSPAVSPMTDTSAASVSIEVVGSPTEDVPLTVRVSGGTEVARRLYVFVNANYGCYSTQGDELDGASTNGDGITSLTPKPVSGESGEALSAGSYSKEYSYTPPEASSPATYTLCGYIAEGEYGYDTPDATGTASFTYISPEAKAAEEKRVAAAKAEEEKRKAEEEKRVAEKKATEEKRAAAAKAEAERHTKERYEEEAPEREAAEDEKRVAAAKAQAHKTPVKHLSVQPVSHSRRSSTDPGYTNLDVTTTPYAYVVVKLSRYGHSTEHFEWGGNSTEVAEVIRWSCKSPGGTYRYVVTAKSDVGPTLTRRGRFAPVSAVRCHALKEEEAKAREHREREAGEERERSEHEAKEEQSRIEREERERLEEYEFNCRAEGGTPIWLFVEGMERRYCRGPDGGLLPVPH